MAEPVVGRDAFINTVHGKLTVIAKQKRGGRTAYVCLCTCGATTTPMRAPYIVRRGELAACYACSHGLSLSGAVVRSAAPMLRGERQEPTDLEDEDDSCACEQAADPIWHVRAQLLELLVVLGPLSTVALIPLAKAHFGWTSGKTREVLAAAEGRELVKRDGLWQRNEARSAATVVATGTRTR